MNFFEQKMILVETISVLCNLVSLGKSAFRCGWIEPFHQNRINRIKEAAFWLITNSGLLVVATISPNWKIDKSDNLFKSIFPDYNEGLWARVKLLSPLSAANYRIQCNQEIKSAKWICSGLDDVYKQIPLHIKV